ncbi:serine/arginine-rich splicing factor 1 [Folsomia candida]|uniref:Serine/arginine-rich splicing factor 1 n=1 Tax=Folsomia candida TaxID=158441 RepID=A0A226EN78_FOLCA|nr:serine/arginine-rich splicing factor 1 [Folsomia candida]OXA58740.1 Serine/arginine-rich splicing factor 1 [Folsomia candida]
MSAKDRRLYVGNLPNDVRSKDIEDLFRKFKVMDVNLKLPRGGLPFAFLEFESSKDAEDALRRRNGYKLDGYRIRVEYPTGSGPRTGGGGGGRGGGGRGGRDGGRDGGRRPGGAAFSRSEFRVKVEGIPPSGSWQDLKDHMREAGEVCYANVSKDGTGIVEFARYDDMKYAIKKLDDSRFRSHEGEVAYIRVRKDSESGSRSRSPRSRSRSYSPAPKRSRGSADRESRSRSRSNDSRR